MLGQKFSHLPEVVKNLMIINGLFFLATWSLSYRGIDLSNMFALHQFLLLMLIDALLILCSYLVYLFIGVYLLLLKI